MSLRSIWAQMNDESDTQCGNSNWGCRRASTACSYTLGCDVKSGMVFRYECYAVASYWRSGILHSSGISYGVGLSLG